MNRLPSVKQSELEELCRRWSIKRLSVYNSGLRGDYHAAIEVNLLAEFDDDAHWSLLDHVAMEEDLSNLFGQKIDLASQRGVEQSANALRPDAIFSSAELIYSSG